jgi:hypothetical protein
VILPALSCRQQAERPSLPLCRASDFGEVSTQQPAPPRVEVVKGLDVDVGLFGPIIIKAMAMKLRNASLDFVLI